MKFFYENVAADETPGTIDEAILGAGLYTTDRGDIDIMWGSAAGAEHATLAWSESGRLAGVNLYDIEETAEGRSMDLRLIWVDKRYRRQGVARQLCEVTLAVVQPQALEVFCISQGSYELMQSLARQYPAIRFRIDAEIERRAA